MEAAHRGEVGGRALGWPCSNCSMRSLALAAITSFEVCALAVAGGEARLLVCCLVSIAARWMLMVLCLRF